MQTKLFRRDFTLVVIGQIISLFGNAILRFALPLYLLRENRFVNAIWCCDRLFLCSDGHSFYGRRRTG